MRKFSVNKMYSQLEAIKAQYSKDIYEVCSPKDHGCNGRVHERQRGDTPADTELSRYIAAERLRADLIRLISLIGRFS